MRCLVWNESEGEGECGMRARERGVLNESEGEGECGMRARERGSVE